MVFICRSAFAVSLMSLLSSCANNKPATASATELDAAQSSATLSAPSAAGATPSLGLQPPPQALPPRCSVSASDVNIVVNALAGPLGGNPAPISNKLYSMNIDDQRPYDYVPTLNANYVAFLAALKPAYLRWPSGYYSQTYQFLPAGTKAGDLTPDLIDGFLGLCHAVGAEPLLAVNIDTGTKENAVELLQFVNGKRKYGVTWWQIGNEPDVDGADRVHNPNSYATTFQSFRAAMLAVDANIKFVGAELFTGADIMGSYSINNPDWLTPILSLTQSTPMDAIAWHYYPLDSSQSSKTSSAVPTMAHALQESAPDWPPAGLNFASIIFPRLRKLKMLYAPKSQLWVDEFAEDSGVANGAGISDKVVGALWAADALGRFADEGADALFRFIFKAGAEHKYSLIDENDLPRPEYYSYWLYAQHMGDHMVQSVSDNPVEVAVHASTRQQDKTLRLVLINKTSSMQNARLSLQGFSPKQASRLRLQGVQGTDDAVTVNGSTLTTANIVRGKDAVAAVATEDACTETVLSLPPLSVTLYIYQP